MSDRKGPITVITSLSEEKNRWKALAFAWKAAAIQAAPPCRECGTPALWYEAGLERYWCATHRPDEAGRAQKVPWHKSLQHAIDLEQEV